MPNLTRELISSCLAIEGMSGPHVYNSATSTFLSLTPQERQVLSLLQNDNTVNPETIARRLEITLEACRHILDCFREAQIIFQPDQYAQFLERIVTPTSGEVYVELTQACNMNCTGCATGVDLRRRMGIAPKTMELSQVNTMLERYLMTAKLRGFTSVKIKWAGGEALLHKPFSLIQEAQHTVIPTLKASYPEIELDQVILTNGELVSASVVSFAKAHGIRMAVSLWGINDTNVQLRQPVRRASGTTQNINAKPTTYDRILAGMQQLVEQGVLFDVNHVITPENAREFPSFLRALWDPSHPSFIGKHWQWPNGPQPIALSVNLFRPQSQDQQAALEAGGYEQMVAGILAGFAEIRTMVNEGVPVPPLVHFDYLDMETLKPNTCGTGINYLAFGPNGAGPCHEDLAGQLVGIDQVIVETAETDVLQHVHNHPYLEERGALIGKNIEKPPEIVDFQLWAFLLFHGGTGCPRSRMHENGTLHSTAGISTRVYQHIIKEWLALELHRRITAL